jgi:hypothetical protein
MSDARNVVDVGQLVPTVTSTDRWARRIRVSDTGVFLEVTTRRGTGVPE